MKLAFACMVGVPILQDLVVGTETFVAEFVEAFDAYVNCQVLWVGEGYLRNCWNES
jgi:hypothetical protein